MWQRGATKGLWFPKRVVRGARLGTAAGSVLTRTPLILIYTRSLLLPRPSFLLDPMTTESREIGTLIAVILKAVSTRPHPPPPFEQDVLIRRTLLRETFPIKDTSANRLLIALLFTMGRLAERRPSSVVGSIQNGTRRSASTSTRMMKMKLPAPPLLLA